MITSEKMDKISVKLNLGCGNHILEGWDNYDIHPSKNVKELDLNKLPYPFPDNHADEILASHVLEHLYLPIYDAMIELHRILKPGGKLIVAFSIQSNIVVHQKDRFNIFYFNAILDNPVGEFIKKERTSRQRKAIYHLVFVKKTSNLYGLLFKKKMGDHSTITGYKKDWILFFKFFPHRLWDMLFNGEIVWTMEAIK